MKSPPNKAAKKPIKTGEKRKSTDVKAAPKATASDAKLDHYVLRLYVTGSTPRSTRAILNIKQICNDHLKGRYNLEVVDLYQQPHLAEGEQIIAAPTLIKYLPLPLRRLIGDMSDTERILVGLDLRDTEKTT